MNITDLIEREYGSRNWVLARRTKNIVARYGEDVVTLNAKRYRELETECEVENSKNSPAVPVLKTILDSYAVPDYLAVSIIRDLRIAGWRVEQVYAPNSRTR